MEIKWGVQSRKKFLVKLTKAINKISKNPNSSPILENFPKVRVSLVSKQTSFYYRIKKDEIEIITVIDNRQNPDDTLEEVKNNFG